VAELTPEQRSRLPDSAFALPRTREFPIHDEEHARKALQLMTHRSHEEQEAIRRAVYRRYPAIADNLE